MKKVWIVPFLASLAVSPQILAAAAASPTNTTAPTTTATPATATPSQATPTKGAAAKATPAKPAAKPTAANSNNTQAELNELKKRIKALEDQQDVDETRNYTIGSDMQFGVGSGTYDDEIYIIDFGLNRDLSLLHERQWIHSKYKSFEQEPHLLISGNISGTAGVNSHIFGIEEGTHEQFMQAEAEIDFTAFINEDWLGYLEFNGTAYGPDRPLTVKQAYTTWGNFDKTPMYVTLGYQYVPFGSFTTNFIENTPVQDMGRIQVPAANGAFNIVTKGDFEVNGAVFWFDGETRASEEFRLDEIGANLQMRQRKLGPQKDMSIMVGVSAVNNIASSNGMYGEVDKWLDGRLEHYVPAVDGRVKFIKGPFSLTGEYLSATTHFADNDFASGQVGEELDGVLPSSAYVEAAYKFDVWKMPTALSARWGETNDALAFGLPSEQYGLSYQLKPYFNTRVTFEYMHSIDYNENAVVYSNGVLENQGTGHTNDLFEAQINVFF